MKSSLLVLVFVILCGTALASTPAPLAHGVVFFCPPKADAALAELAKIRADGYNLVKFASWCWTLPVAGSDLERNVQAVLDWCDAHDMRFFLLQNIQFGSQGEGGGLDDAVQDPLRAARFLDDWVRVLKGHKCVTGVILGNEVGPVAGNPKDHPKWWAGFLTDLQQRYQSIGRLNATWGTSFADFSAVTIPAAGCPGQVDYRRYAVQVFDHFYGTLFKQVCEPRLGKLLYGTKTGGDPLLQRACESFSMTCWDDVLADYPQWRIKAMGDIARTTGKPVFNSELHLYHDTYFFGGSPAKTRYRYLLSALNDEWITASFAWGQWTKPAIQEMHKATPAIFAELRSLEPQLRRFNTQQPQVHVVLSEPIANDDVAMQRLYSAIAGLGCAWEFICPQDISRITRGAVYVPRGSRLSPEACRALLALPGEVPIVFAAHNALSDEYGHALSASLLTDIGRRVSPRYGPRALPVPSGERLAAPYSDRVEASYLTWSEKQGHYHYPLTYPRLEARRVRDGEGWLVAVINHATDGEPVKARLPYISGGTKSVRELTHGGRDLTSPAAEETFSPLEVRIYSVKIAR